MDVNEDLKFWRKFKKKNRGGGGRWSGGGRVGGGGGGGFRLDVDAMLGGSV